MMDFPWTRCWARCWVPSDQAAHLPDLHGDFGEQCPHILNKGLQELGELLLVDLHEEAGVCDHGRLCCIALRLPLWIRVWR